MNAFDTAHAVQALDYLASRAVGRRMTKLVALKLLYLADRDHLRKHGRTVLGDEYFAMPYGPVASHSKDLIERMAGMGGDPGGYLRVFNAPGNRAEIVPALPPDTRMLSETEMESLDLAAAQLFLHADIVDFTHEFPEWKRHKRALDSGARSVPMDYLDFFLPCEVPGIEYCDAPARLVEINRELYAESMQCLP